MTTFKIQANEKGSRFLEVSEAQMQAIKKYNLFGGLLNSTGVVDESTLNKLHLNVRSLLSSLNSPSDLLDLCQNVLFHDNMKTLGLCNLIRQYVEWKEAQPAEDEAEA